MVGHRSASARRFASNTVLRRAVEMVEPLEKRQVMASTLATVVDADGNLTVENLIAPQQSLYTGKSLSGPSKADIGAIAVDFLRSHAADFDLLPGDVAEPIITGQYSDDDTGIGHVYLRQTLNGLPVLTADMTVNLMPDGSVISAAGSFVPNLARAGKNVKGPKVSAGGALVNAATQLDLGTASYRVTSAKATGDRATLISAPALSQNAIKAQLRYVPTDAGLNMVWNFDLNLPDNEHWYNVGVGGNASEVVYASDWVDNAQYNVVPRPNSSPTDGGFAVVENPDDPDASPYGWHDTNGVIGAEFTDTRGNNVDAHLDRVNDNVADGTRPSGGAALNFTGANFTQAPASEPTVLVNQNVAQTNLFYANNISHDIFYRYGFTPASGSFQTNGYGEGGLGNDAVQADAQDGGGTNNANFATPPDGQAGRMQMYLFTAPTPDRDGDLDMDVVYHEYGHGVTNRLTGGPANSDALDALQSGGMGEGWSDFFSLMFTQRATDTQTTSHPVGTYVLNQGGTGAGIRRYPYNFNMIVNPLTIDAYGDSGVSTAGGSSVTRSLEVHNTGEIWTSALWDMNWLLINKYGFGANLEDGFDPTAIKGNQLAMKLVMDALKLQPANPTFKDARDAILQADANLSTTLGTPSNAAQIWTAFARRGMGTGFKNEASSDIAVTASFTTPVPDPTVTSTLPATTFTPFGTVSIRFDQPMNTGSFSVADDLLAFTNPNGTNLLPSVTGFTWTDSTTLRLNLSGTQTVRGLYSLTLSPGINALDNGNGLDTNRNGTPGELVADRFTGTINLLANVGPEGFGYKTAPYPYEGINLAIGGAGVTTLVNAADDASSAVNLGANTFNFYGTTYSASQVFASSNGLISFGAGNASYQNDTLANGGNVPTRAIAPWWSDFRTDTTASGATDSAVLYQIDAANSRLIIEWSDVTSYYGSGATTFQAILQLNTGATPGRILYNYVDTDMNNYGSNGGVGTFGIKDSGTPVANRLLLNYDNPANPWIAGGRAVETALDVAGPKVAAEAFDFLTNQSFTVTFNEDVGASLSLADLVLTNTTSGLPVSPPELSLSYNAVTRTATVTKLGTRLNNGNYTLTFLGNGLTDATGNFLDGDGDNVIGGNHVFSTFVLAGDTDRNRVVNFSDFATLQSFYGQAGNFAQGDLDYNGVIDFSDFTILQANYGATV